MENVDVIIPVLNEEKTIKEIVRIFNNHPRVDNVYVMIDAMTDDDSYGEAVKGGAIIRNPFETHGKGELIKAAYSTVYLTDRVILCDGDYTAFSSRAIDMALMTPGGLHMQIVYPRMPSEEEWSEKGLEGFPFMHYPWMAMAGMRCIPAMLIDRERLHGYLVETQLNAAALRRGVSIGFAACDDIIAPLRFTPARLRAMEEDRRWGIDHGVF